MPLFALNYYIWDKEPLWIAVSILAIICGFLLLARSKQITDLGKQTNPVFRGYGLFCFGYAAGRILFILSDFEFNIHDQSALYVQLVLLAYIVGILSAIFLISTFESIIMKMKNGLLTKIYIIIFLVDLGMFFILLIPNIPTDIITYFRYLNIGASLIGFLIVLGLYYKIIRETTGDLRKNALLSFIGLILLIAGTFLDSQLVINYIHIPIWIPGIPPIVGIIILMYSQRSV
jgi:hypothetical protein